jgi:transposase
MEDKRHGDRANAHWGGTGRRAYRPRAAILLATHSRIAPAIDAARAVKRHWDGILQWFDSKIANGLIVGVNSLVQVAKAKARGYRSTRNLKLIIHLLAGKLDLRLHA